MTRLIDKDAVVAEIDNMLKTKEQTSHLDNNAFNSGRWKALKKVKDILDSIEVKEDVDAEIVEVEDSNNSIYAYTYLEICTDEDLSKICKAGDKAKVIIIKQK